jgi:hypothetical protein
MDRWKAFEQCDIKPTALYNRDTNIYIVKSPKDSLSLENIQSVPDTTFLLAKKPIDREPYPLDCLAETKPQKL